jgi:hypothetical protein
MVYGNLHVRVIPYGAGVEVPESLGDLTLIFKSISEEIEFPVQITEPHGGYYLILSGGHYQIKTLEISALDVGAITSIPSMGWATIEIPDNGCVYIGRLSLNYYRLPPLSFTEQVAMVKEIAQGKDAILTYLESGSLVPVSAEIDLPDLTERVEGSEGCEVQLISYVN